MLRLNFDGSIKEPSRLKKSFGGPIDATNGVPASIEIPTTGSHSGVVVSDTGDLFYGKTLTRTASGLACVRGDAILVKGEMNAFKVTACVMGGGSSATSGQTRRDFRVGFWKPDLTIGAYIEYINPDSGTEGVHLKVISDGSTETYPLNYQVNNPSDNYYITFWLTRNLSTGGWTATLAEGSEIRSEVDLPPSELSLNNKYIRAYVEWDWTYASGSFSPSIANLDFDIYYRF